MVPRTYTTIFTDSCEYYQHYPDEHFSKDFMTPRYLPDCYEAADVEVPHGANTHPLAERTLRYEKQSNRLDRT